MTVEAYDPSSIHPLFPRYCPCQNCSYYLDLDNYITLDGTYRVKKDFRRRQRFYCHGGDIDSQKRHTLIYSDIKVASKNILKRLKCQAMV